MPLRMLVYLGLETNPSVSNAKSYTLRNLGSSASLNPSPSMLSPSTASAMAMPGKIATHGASSMYLRPELSIVPHDGSGGCVPSPRNDSVASLRMAVENDKVAWMMSGAAMFGST